MNTNKLLTGLIPFYNIYYYLNNAHKFNSNETIIHGIFTGFSYYLIALLILLNV